MSPSIRYKAMLSVSRNKEFESEYFERMFRMPEHTSDSEWKAFINKPRTLHLLTKPMKELFVEGLISPAKEELDAAGVKRFDFEDTDFSLEQLDYIKTVAVRTKLSNLFVFKVINDIISRLSEPKFSNFVRSFSIEAVEDAVVKKWLDNKLNYLRGLIFFTAKVNSSVFATNDADKVVSQSIKNNALTKAMLANLREQNTDSLPQYFSFELNHAAQVNLLKQKELIFRVLHNVFYVSGLDRERLGIVKELVGLLGKEIFDGGVNATLNATKLKMQSLNEGTFSIIDRTSVTVYMLFISIFVGPFKTSRREGPSGEEIELNFQALQSIHENIKGLEAGITSNIIISEIYHVLVLATAFLSKNPKTRQEADVICSENPRLGELNPSFVFSDMIESIKKMFPKNGGLHFRWSLKDFLNCLSLVSIEDTKEVNPYFYNVDDFNQMFIRILREVLKSRNLMSQFWTEFHRKEYYIEVVKGIFGSYPEYTQSFIGLATALVGKNNIESAANLRNELFNLKFITLSKDDELNKKIENVIVKNGTQMVKLTEDYIWNSNIVLPKGVTGHSVNQQDRTLRFQFDLNFIAHVYKTLLGISYFPVEALSDDQVGLLVFFCKLIEANPTIILEIHEDVVVKRVVAESNGAVRREYPVTIIMLLIDLAKVITLNENNPIIHVHIFKALAAILASGNYEAAAFMVKMVGMVRDQQNNLDGLFLEFYESFSTSGQNSPVPKTRKLYYQGMEAVVVILRRLMANERSILENLNLLEGNAVAGEQSNAQTQLIQEFQMLTGSLNSYSIERTEAEICHFFNKALMDSKAILPFNFEFYFKSILSRIGGSLAREEFLSSDQDLEQVYSFYGEYLSLLTVFISKIGFSIPSKTIETSKRPDYPRILSQKFKEILNGLSVVDTLKKVLNVVENNVRPQGVNADIRIRLPLINSHLYNVENNAELEVRGDVVQRFLIRALECFGELTDLCRQSSRRQDDPLYPAFLSLFRTNFVNRDGLMAGEAQVKGLMYQVNFIVGLFMATVNSLDYAEMPKLQTEVDKTWFIYNNNCVQWPESLEPIKSADDSLFYDDRLFQSAGLDIPNHFRKHYFVSSAGYAALTSLLKYWRSIPNAKVPVLIDFLDKSSFDVPNREMFMRVFAFEISNQIRDRNLEALEFLVECNKSQPEFMAEMLKYLDDKQTKSNHLIRSLKSLIQESFRKHESKSISPFEQSLYLALICNLGLAVFTLLENPRLRKVHLDSIWEILFVDVNDLLLKMLDDLKQPFLDLSVVAAGFKDQNNIFLVLNTPSRAMSLIRLRKLLEESKLVDKMVRTLMQVVTNSILMVLQGNKDSFIADLSQDFFKKFFERFSPLLRLVLSGELFTLTEVMFVLEKSLVGYVSKMTPQPQLQWNQNNNNFVSNAVGLKVVDYKERVTQADRTFDRQHKTKTPTPAKRLEFNPLLVFMNLAMAKCDDQVSFAVSDFTSVINVARVALQSKHKLQDAWNDFLRIVLSVGVKGTFFGEKLALIPGVDSIQGMVKRLNASIVLPKSGGVTEDSRKQALPVKHPWLLSDVYSNFSPSTDVSGLQEVYLGLPHLRAAEIQLLNPFQIDKYQLPFNFFTYFANSGVPKTDNPPEKVAIEDLFFKISMVCKLIDSLHQQIDKQQPSQDIYLGDPVTFRSVIRMLLLLIQAANHLVISFPDFADLKSVSREDKIREIFDVLYNLSTHIGESDRINSDRLSSNLMDDLLQAFFLFRKLIGSKEDLPDAERFWKSFVQRPPSELRKFVPTLSYMAECSSYLLREPEVNAISKVVTQKETMAEEIVSILQLFGQDYFNNPVKLEMYAESDLLDSLCSIPLLDMSEDFGRGVFYKEGKTTPSHTLFVHLLSFMANLTVAAREVPLIQTKAVSFLAKYRQRIEQILGLWSWNYGSQIGLSGFPQEVYTFAFLEELQGTLSFLRALSMYPSILNGPNEQLFHRIYSQLTTQTLRFISTEVYGQSARLKIGTVSRIFDLFKPVSLFEESIHKIHLKESLSYQHLKAGSSLQKQDLEPKQTLLSPNLSSNQFNIVTTHGSHSSSLQNFMVEIKLLEIIFLATDLFRTLTFHSQVSNWKNQVTSKERTSGFYVTLSSIFFDSQVYLKNYLAKMSLKDYYLEGIWHLMLLKRSEVTTVETRGLFQLQTVYSYQEIKNLVRRAFELTIYAQRMCIKCFESPLLRGNAEEIAIIRKCQDESQKVIAEFLRYENFGGNPKQSVNLNRSRREGSLNQDPLRSLNQKQHLMSQNLSIRTDVNQSTGIEVEENNFFELHKKVIERFTGGHKWKS